MGLTTREALKFGALALKKANIVNYKNEAREILENLLKKTPEELFLIKEKNISETNNVAFIKRIKKRTSGVPLQYITKVGHFYSRAFYVSKGVLIPRQETEILVETVLKTFEARNNVSCLDMCSGSGCIGISLALENKNFKRVVLADTSKKALLCSVKNIKAFSVKRRCNAVLSKFFSNIPNTRFDVICSNPPYVSEKEYPLIEKQVKDYEPKLALVSKDNGLLHIKKIAHGATGFLKQGGLLFFEVGQNQSEKVKEILLDIGYCDLLTYNDLNQIKRIVVGKWKK